MAASTCTSLCSSLQFSNLTVSVNSCNYYSAGSQITIDGGQSMCSSTASPEVDLCRVTLGVATSDTSQNYMEVWMPTEWNGRFMATDNKGLAGCVGYSDMAYTSSMGFAVIGDNAGHNGTSYDGRPFSNNDVMLDWVHRSRHAAVVAGKQVVEQHYGTPHNYSYFIGCSTGGRQGMKSAQSYPEDFDGIIAGSPAMDLNHLIDWSGRFYLLTGFGTDDRAMSTDQWAFVHEKVLNQCDGPLDGVSDGIIEDSTICEFNATVLLCSEDPDPRCLTPTQVTTVNNVYSELYDQQGTLLFPRLSPGTELDAAYDGTLTGSVQGLAHDWFAYAIWNSASWDPKALSQTDYSKADELDSYHGDASTWSADLSGFRAAGGKLLVHHGMQDHVVTGENSQRYYLRVAETMGLDSKELDEFYRFFRVSGAGHCQSGVGAWMFGQSAATRNAPDSVIQNIIDWVEEGKAPETLTGTKFVDDDSNQGVEFQRAHCRFPYRTTYDGVGNPNVTSSWSCVEIENWRECEAGKFPRLC